MGQQRKRSEPPRPRAAWFASEIPRALAPEVRERLAEINRGYTVGPEELDTLDRAIGEILHYKRLDASVKAQRAAVAEVRDTATALHDAIRGLYPRSRAEVLASLIYYGKPPDLLRSLPRALVALRVACTDALREIPAKGGRPSEQRRDAVIAAGLAFVNRLRPTRPRAVIRRALTLVEDDVNTELKRRQRESVKAILSGLKLFVPVDLDAIIAKTLQEQLP